jgi:hypothetical protein
MLRGAGRRGEDEQRHRPRTTWISPLLRTLHPRPAAPRGAKTLRRGCSIMDPYRCQRCSLPYTFKQTRLSYGTHPIQCMAYMRHPANKVRGSYLPLLGRLTIRLIQQKKVGRILRDFPSSPPTWGWLGLDGLFWDTPV